MDVQLILKIAGIGMLTAVCAQILSRSGRDDISLLLSVAGTVIVLFMLVDKISGLFDTVKNIFGL